MFDRYHEGVPLNDFHHSEGPGACARIRKPNDDSVEQLSARGDPGCFLWARQENVLGLESYSVTHLRMRRPSSGQSTPHSKDSAFQTPLFSGRKLEQRHTHVTVPNLQPLQAVSALGVGLAAPLGARAARSHFSCAMQGLAQDWISGAGQVFLNTGEPPEAIRRQACQLRPRGNTECRNWVGLCKDLHYWTGRIRSGCARPSRGP
jgi:hypothetical protein